MSVVVTMSEDGLTAEGLYPINNGSTVKSTISWENVEKVPPVNEIRKLFVKEMNEANRKLKLYSNQGQYSKNASSTVKKIRLLFGWVMHVTVIKNADWDEASVAFGKKKLIAPVNPNGHIRFSEKRWVKLKTPKYGAGNHKNAFFFSLNKT